MYFRSSWWCMRWLLARVTSVMEDNYNGDWDHGQKRLLYLSEGNIFLRIRLKHEEGHADKEKTLKRIKSERRGKRRNRRLLWTVIEQKTKPSSFQHWGHELLLLPENIHLRKWNIDLGDLDNTVRLILSSDNSPFFPPMNEKKKKKNQCKCSGGVSRTSIRKHVSWGRICSHREWLPISRRKIFFWDTFI